MTVTDERPTAEAEVKTEFRVLITGSREWKDWGTIKKALLALNAEQADKFDQITLVHGDARGADKMSEWLLRNDANDELNLPNRFLGKWKIETHPCTEEQWSLFGKRAGYLRNERMVNAGADVCLAFIKDGSKGASMCANLAEEKGITTIRFTESAESVVKNADEPEAPVEF